MWNRPACHSLSCLVLAACAAHTTADPPEASSALSCPVERCTGDACDQFDPAGDIVDGTGIARHDAPDVVQPDVPLIRRRVVLADGDQYLAPVVPAWRSSADGRIAIVDNAIRPIHLEQLRDHGPISQQRPDLAAQIFGAGPSVMATFGDTSTGGFLCTPARTNPAPCPNNPGDDCYDLVIGRRDDDAGMLLSAPLHVRVSSPKTPAAAVAEATVGAITSIKLPFGSSGEMVPTGDGHLVTLRIHEGGDDGAPASITYRLGPHHDVTKPVSLAYAYAADPCDITEWFAHDDDVLTSIRPWPAAYTDPRLHDVHGPIYGIAARPIRDPDGHELGEEDILSGSYPWIDREGNNLMFSTVDPHPLSKALQARYPIAIEGKDPLAYIQTAPRGFAVVGAWTQGKTVMLDGLLNNEDYGFDPAATHRLVLYQAQAGAPRAVRVNGGSNNGVRALGLVNANGNNDEIESLENTLAMHAAALPVTPRDVVWTVTRGLASDEIAFDDFTDPNLVLLAEMNAAWTAVHDRQTGVQDAVAGLYADGFPADPQGAFDHDPTAIRVQNAAASSIYGLASTGRLTGGDPIRARIEPVALGGVRGRGLWLEPEVRLQFTLPDQPAAAGHGFYASVFVDARDHLDGTVPVLAFSSPNPAAGWSLALADGGATAVIGHGQGASRIESRIDLSCAAASWKLRWHQLGVQLEPGRATLIVDGNVVGSAPLAADVPLAAGTLSAGGVRGWYDEVRLEIDGNGGPLTGRPAPELLCNIAHGTVVRAAGQDRCATDYTTDLGVGRGKLPAGTTGRRDAILAGDAPLYWDQPRPDSQHRAFCLSCHVDAAQDPGRAPKLTLEALTPGSQPAAQDPRTQPLQPPSYDALPAQARGNLPAHWIGGQYPAQATQGPLPILQWTVPHSP
ncbi:MAG TPA: hypothetical protein VH165_29565 [Kofleriaceae bacterium]|jgi:hypothetical protein|nr:hypothetical protein [Kofleriaceae bacterium]